MSKQEKLEPIPVEAYKCPKCERILVGTKGEAQEHVDVPFGINLPQGLALKIDNCAYIIIRTRPIMNSDLYESREHPPHSYMHDLILHLPGPDFRVRGPLNSEYFKQKKHFFLTEEEFDKLAREYKEFYNQEWCAYTLEPEDLVRATPKILEALIGEPIQ